MVSLKFMQSRIVNQLIQDSINTELQDRNTINANQHSSVENKSYLSTLVMIFDKITSLVIKSRTVLK